GLVWTHGVASNARRWLRGDKLQRCSSIHFQQVQGIGMLPNLKRLLLGICLIVLASTVLLLSDLKQRTPTAGAMPHIGLLQHASVVLLDDTVRGMVDSLAENGFVDGKTIVIQKYNAQGDIAVANL